MAQVSQDAPQNQCRMMQCLCHYFPGLSAQGSTTRSSRMSSSFNTDNSNKMTVTVLHNVHIIALNTQVYNIEQTNVITKKQVTADLF